MSWSCRFLVEPLSHFNTIEKIRHAENLRQELSASWKLQERTQSLPDRKHESVQKVLNDPQLFIEWLIGLRSEVLERMSRWHIPHALIRQPNIMRFFLDQVVRERAKKLNFILNKWGRPIIHFNYSEESFRELLKNGELFYDQAGVLLTDTYLLWHGKRSHALQILFVAEHVPDFLEIYKGMGDLELQGRVWDSLFDVADEINLSAPAVFIYYLNSYLTSGRIKPLSKSWVFFFDKSPSPKQ